MNRRAFMQKGLIGVVLGAVFGLRTESVTEPAMAMLEETTQTGMTLSNWRQ